MSAALAALFQSLERPVRVPHPAARPPDPVAVAQGRDPLGPAGAARLREAARSWEGVRYERHGKTRAGVDDDALVHHLYKDALGIELPISRHAQIKLGVEVPVDLANPGRHLKPGDLLFMIVMSRRPRSVGLYLGDGKWVHATAIRGVVIEDVPDETPNYLWLVGRRPLSEPNAP